MEYGFTYFPGKGTRNKWELIFTIGQLEDIYEDKAKYLDLWACDSKDCGCKFYSKNETCFYCDYVDEWLFRNHARLSTESMTEPQKLKQAEKELTKILADFRPNKKEVEKKISFLPFLGGIAGLGYGLLQVFCFWPSDISKTVPFSSWYRLAALPPAIGFPITTILIGIIAGKVIELLIRRLRN